MTTLVVAICVGLVGYWAGAAHARFVMKSELRDLPRRVAKYTNPRRPW